VNNTLFTLARPEHVQPLIPAAGQLVPSTWSASSTPAGLVGNTPVLWVGEPFASAGRGFWAKLEGFNPGGMKDRPALHMVRRARERGDLLPGAPVIESTSGTLGLGLALAAMTYGHPITLGYPVDFVTPVTAPRADPALTAHARHGVAGIAAGRREYRYPNDQPAATLWYHDHRMGLTGPSVYRGLAGFYLIGDEVEDALPLPRGERDIPLMIADRQFNEDGSLYYPLEDPTMRTEGVTVQYHHSGMVGDTVTVNGVAWPALEVDAALYRLRFCNASNARPYRLELDPPPPDGAGFVQIGSDLGLLPKPVPYDMFVISPGERYDMLIDFSRYRPGTRVVLKNNIGDRQDAYVMRFDVARRVTDEARIPETLTAEPTPPPRTEGTADRRFSFFIGPSGVKGPPMVNGNIFDLTRIDARTKLDTTEVWDFTADPIHPIHLHGAHFRILKRNGRPPEPQDAGWKDTVFVPTGGMRLSVTFSGYRGKYLFHCHNLEHGDTGMMANLNIV
jgi:spore coat protein A, manganese oxidase